MNSEDEEFSRLEMESKVRREYALQALHDENEQQKPTRAQLIAEVAILSELVTVLNARVIKLEAELKK